MGPDGGVGENLGIPPLSFGVDRQPRGVSEQREPNPLNIKSDGLSVASDRHPEINEDAFFVSESDGEFKGAGVFDGVGGEAGGHIAAETAAKVVKKYLEKVMRENPNGLTYEQAVLVGYTALIVANRAVLREQQRKRVIKNKDGREETVQYSEMSTTGCIVVPYQRVQDGKTTYGVVVAHVGDSRAYLYGNETLQEITLDDGLPRRNLLEITLDDGLSRRDLLEQQARQIQAELSNATDVNGLSKSSKGYWGNTNMITQALGIADPIPRITVVEGLGPGFSLLVCSDGVHDNLTDRGIAGILKNAENPDDAVKKLIEGARNIASQLGNEKYPRAKPDDMTAVVVRFVGDESLQSSSEKPSPSFQELPPNSLVSILRGKELNVPGKINLGDTVWITRALEGNMPERVDYGWRVAEISEDQVDVNVKVTKQLPDGSLLEQIVRYSELVALNSETSIEDIPFAKSPPDLIRIISLLIRDELTEAERNALGNLLPEQLGKIISNVITGTSQIDTLPNIPGLRKKVGEFMRGRHSPVEEERPASPFDITPGKEVVVRRSSGRFEGGWKVVKVDEEYAIVVKRDEPNNETLIKEVPLRKLLEWNMGIEHKNQK